ncbi:unnamed protein product [Camellia sinensis]
MGMVTTVKSEMRPLKHRLFMCICYWRIATASASALAGPSFSVYYNYRFEEKFKIPRSQPGIGGLEDLKLIYGIKGPGMQHRGRRESKQYILVRAYNVEETAARVYDLAAIKYWGPTTFTNFPVSDYETDRNNAECNKRGVLGIFEKEKQWFLKRRIQVQRSCKAPSQCCTQEEVAHAYDIAAIEYRGANVVTNFDLSTYIRWLRPGLNSLAP